MAVRDVQLSLKRGKPCVLVLELPELRKERWPVVERKAWVRFTGVSR